MSFFHPARSRTPGQPLARFRRDRRSTVMVEFAIVGPVFLAMLFVAFDFAYINFLRSSMDSALQTTAREIQVGQAQTYTSRSALDGLLCTNALGLLNCNNMFIRVESINQTSCPGGAGAPDLWDATDGNMPTSGGALALGLYGGNGGTAGPTTCQNASSSSGFCVAGTSANSPVLIVLSAVYVSPSFVGKLMPGTYTYNGSAVDAVFSSAAFITEGFVQTGTSTC